MLPAPWDDDIFLPDTPNEAPAPELPARAVPTTLAAKPEPRPQDVAPPPSGFLPQPIG